jgi:hypothetical protein
VFCFPQNAAYKEAKLKHGRRSSRARLATKAKASQHSVPQLPILLVPRLHLTRKSTPSLTFATYLPTKQTLLSYATLARLTVIHLPRPSAPIGGCHNRPPSKLTRQSRLQVVGFPTLLPPPAKTAATDMTGTYTDERQHLQACVRNRPPFYLPEDCGLLAPSQVMGRTTIREIGRRERTAHNLGLKASILCLENLGSEDLAFPPEITGFAPGASLHDPTKTDEHAVKENSVQTSAG